MQKEYPMPAARMTIGQKRKGPSQEEFDAALKAYNEVKNMSLEERASVIGGIVLMRRSEGVIIERLESEVARYQARAAELERDFVHYSLGIPNDVLMKILQEI